MLSFHMQTDRQMDNNKTMCPALSMWGHKMGHTCTITHVKIFYGCLTLYKTVNFLKLKYCLSLKLISSEITDVHTTKHQSIDV